MSGKPEERRKSPLSAVLATLIVAALPFAYLLSVGPANVFVNYFPWTQQYWERFYYPLTWLADRSSVFRQIIEAYTSWWQ
jgi:hypothetical protein